MKLKVLLVLPAVFALSCSSNTAKRAAVESEPALRKFAAEATENSSGVWRRGVIAKAAAEVRARPPGQTPVTRRKTIESILADLQETHTPPSRSEETTPALGQGPKEVNENIQTVELELAGSARINRIVKSSDFDEDETKLGEFLTDAYCLNLEAIKNNEPAPSDEDYEKLIVDHILQLPSNEESKLIRKARTFYGLGQRLYGEKLSDSAFDAAVTLYCP